MSFASQGSSTSSFPRCVHTFERQLIELFVFINTTGSSMNSGSTVCGLRPLKSSAFPTKCHVREKIFSFESSKRLSSVQKLDGSVLALRMLGSISNLSMFNLHKVKISAAHYHKLL